MIGRLLPALAWLALSGAAAGAFAAAPDTARATGLVLHGFGTLGLARSDDEGAQYIRDLTQRYGTTSRWSTRLDSVLGLQANYRLHDNAEGVMQVVSRYHAEGRYTPELFWAYLGYTPDSTTNLRFGRLGTEFYMLADSRLVGFANLTVRPPPDYYGSLIVSYIDGADAAKVIPLGNGLLRGKIFAGLSPEYIHFSKGLTWNLSGSLVAGGYLDYQAGPWQIRAGQTRIRFKRDLPVNPLTGLDITGLVPEMKVADTWFRYDSVGAAYDSGPLQVQLMYSQVHQDSAAFEDAHAGYAIVSYRTGKVTPYLGYSAVTSEAARFTSSPPPLVAAVARSLSAETHSDQHTWFLGVRWDIADNLALKAQIDRIRGASTSKFPFREDNNWDGSMTVYSLALDFVF